MMYVIYRQGTFGWYHSYEKLSDESIANAGWYASESHWIVPGTWEE